MSLSFEEEKKQPSAEKMEEQRGTQNTVALQVEQKPSQEVQTEEKLKPIDLDDQVAFFESFMNMLKFACNDRADYWFRWNNGKKYLRRLSLSLEEWKKKHVK